MPSDANTLALSPLDALVVWAQAKPEASALVVAGVPLSYGQLLQRVQARAARLKACGVRRGDVVALVLPDSEALRVEQVAQFYAIAWLGASIFPVYPEVLPARIGPLANRFGARWIISPQAVQGCLAQPIPSDSFASTVNFGGEAERLDSPEQALLFEFTSGTTGDAKAVLFSGAETLRKILVTAQAFGWGAEDRVVLPLPWPYKVGIKGLVRILTLGATYVDTPYPSTCAALSLLIRTQGVNCVGSAPWQLRRLVADAVHTGQRLHPPLRVLGSAGAMLSPQDIAGARHWLAPNFHVGYGCTEVGLLGHLGPDRTPDAAYATLPGIEAGALDQDHRPLPVGHAGRLRFRAPWFTRGYAHSGDAAADGFRDGWFVTSDWGCISPEGDITLLGRADDTINVGGAKVLPSEVEGVLRSHPGIADAAVLALPHALAGEKVVAFVVLRWALALPEVVNYLQERLDPWMVPADFVKLDAIAYNAGGKACKEELIRLYRGLKTA